MCLYWLYIHADFQKGYVYIIVMTLAPNRSLHVILYVYFTENEEYYLGGDSQSSLQGERSIEEIEASSC